MKFTIIQTDRQTAFIQQQYATLEESKKRLDELNAKFGNRLKNKADENYSLAIVGVDDEGQFHELTEAQEAKRA